MPSCVSRGGDFILLWSWWSLPRNYKDSQSFIAKPTKTLFTLTLGLGILGYDQCILFCERNMLLSCQLILVISCVLVISIGKRTQKVRLLKSFCFQIHPLLARTIRPNINLKALCYLYEVSEFVHITPICLSYIISYEYCWSLFAKKFNAFLPFFALLKILFLNMEQFMMKVKS